MKQVTEVLVPSLEELVLIEMPKLVRCSFTCVEGLNCSLRVLQIGNCEVLKEFDLLENNGRFEIEQRSWLPGLFSSDMTSEHTTEDVTTGNRKAFPSLQCLSIEACGMAGKWLSLLLRHAPHLEELNVWNMYMTEEEGDSSSGEQYGALNGLAQDGLVHMPLDLMSSLKKIIIMFCRYLTFYCSEEEGFSGFTSLQELTIWECPKLLSSLVHKDGNDDQANGTLLLPASLEKLLIYSWSQETLQPCFPSDLTNLKRLNVRSVTDLHSLRLHSCTALEVLTIAHCESLTALEGLQSLVSLRHLVVSNCPGLGPCLESSSRQGYELFPRLETLRIDDPSVLTTSFCNHLTSLRCLELVSLVLTEEQGRALVLLKSLEELEFNFCTSLPAELHLLPSLKRLELYSCSGISRLPGTGLPLSLEKLEIIDCSEELTNQCRALATSKLRVKIDRAWLVS
jgi:hypothetical protein